MYLKSKLPMAPSNISVEAEALTSISVELESIGSISAVRDL